jgi:hypothetical protein
VENSEQQLAIIPAKKYAIYVTDKRLAFIKTSSQTTGTIVGGAFGGAIGSVIGEAVEAAMRKRRGSKKGDESSVVSEIDKMLRKDKKNYALTYDELESIVFSKSQWSKLDPVRLAICSKNGKQEAKVELTPNEFEQLFKVFSSIPALSGKVKEQQYS